MFIEKKTWVVGNLSEDELRIAKGGPRDKSCIVVVIAFMTVLGVLELTAFMIRPEIGVLPLIVLWVGLALALGCLTVIDSRQGWKYSRVVNSRKTHQVEDDDPFDRLMREVDDDRELLDRHHIAADILFEKTDAWKAWERLREHPSLPEVEQDHLNELINSHVQGIARMM